MTAFGAIVAAGFFRRRGVDGRVVVVVVFVGVGGVYPEGPAGLLRSGGECSSSLKL